MVENLWAPFLEIGLELREKNYIAALLVMRGVPQYVFFSITPSRPREKVPTSSAAVGCHRVNDLSLVVTLPHVQQASEGRIACDACALWTRKLVAKK